MLNFFKLRNSWRDIFYIFLLASSILFSILQLGIFLDSTTNDTQVQKSQIK